MSGFILIALVVLVCAAILDLVVGVGNDAVNFLNSAIGSKVASFKRIMWVASVGIFLGALSSAGMMEIAREGIFNPEYFSLTEVLTIFLAVMLTDIILLDAFNTLGLPTSTTVSIIFELLGASLVIAIFKIVNGNEPLNWLFNNNDAVNGIKGYINWSKTNTIISSIFLSVLISFTVGIFVMFFSRLIFGYHFLKNKRIVTILWCGFAMVALSYFLVYKGMKSTYSTETMTYSELVDYKSKLVTNDDSSYTNTSPIIIPMGGNENLIFTPEDDTPLSKEKTYTIFFGSRDLQSCSNYLKDHMSYFLLGMLFFWCLLFFILDKFKVSPLKIVVFAGTFSLAMAFAGNDLVNFIGVPLAGWQGVQLMLSQQSLMSQSIDPDTFMMFGLRFPIQTPYLYLVTAGIVMILTLWFSKKAKTVIETEVNLGSSDEIDEKFSSNAFSRWIVKQSLHLNNKLTTTLPVPILQKLQKKFTPLDLDDEVEKPAFDLVRASVNLTVASMLIAIATSYKLPLSTTYVSFMVAMGSSLADRAWGRESAAYRIAGVLNVIAGWLITALIALTISAIFAFIILKFHWIGFGFLVFLVVVVIYGTNYYHNYQKAIKENSKKAYQAIDLTTNKVLSKTARQLASSLAQSSIAFKLAIDGLTTENESDIKESEKLYVEIYNFYNDIKNNLYKAIKKSKLAEKQTAQLYILSNDMMQDLLQSLQLIINAAALHVRNGHKPLTESQKMLVFDVEMEVKEYLQKIIRDLSDGNFEDLLLLKDKKRMIFDQIENALITQVDGISNKEFGFKNTDLAFTILLETKDLVAISFRFIKLFRRLSKGESPLGNRIT